MNTRPAERRRPDWLDAAAAALLVTLVAGTAALLLTPGFVGHITAPGLDLVFDTTATVITATVAALAWVRYSDRREPVSHAESAAFLVLAIVNFVAVAGSVTSNAGTTSNSVGTGQAQAYIFTAGRTLAALLLVLGGITSLRGGRPRFPMPMLLAPAIIIGVVIVAVQLFGDQLPQLIVPSDRFTSPVQPNVSTTPLGVVAQVSGALLTMVAAIVWHRLWHRDLVISHAYLTLGLIIASFAQLFEVLYPGVHPLQVSIGDLLWLTFGAVLVLSIDAEARSAVAELRTLNTALENLRHVEVERASLEERARLSRELHDGLSQNLWLAKLKVGWLAARPNLDAETSAACGELTDAIDASLAEARQAVMALRQGTDGTGAPLPDLIQRFVDEFADRFGVRTQFQYDQSPVRLSPRVEAEVLRVAQEALSNVHRHADATLIQVILEAHDGFLTLTVIDNGKGFDPATIGDGGYGLVGMRERAALINARLTVNSRPLDGTRVTIQIPVPDGTAVEQGPR